MKFNKRYHNYFQSETDDNKHLGFYLMATLRMLHSIEYITEDRKQT